ncbi:MAG: hypothetical protein LQ350_004772 [Teloschistes chrysophthalmus]|nr:MAG: hypothetical protein LQ350_004772 [Niorma chrysophthalma]
MAPKTAKPAVGSTHTAGIYADMTVDGPEIGTLVVVLDRAKNLPNRKSMGKQDPYCAARLGKEAKKTETDKRGGQTPRWDQELRFTVHESPDYYQLKVSVFNDDKKTELIGETRIALEDIIVPGGGQNDTWHHLHCKGRFAGEIRIELTYYDSRPKEEKIPERPVELAPDGRQESSRDSLGGPRGPKPPKRRPLPANPVDAIRPGMPEHSHSSPLPLPTQPPLHQPAPVYPDRQGHRDVRLESSPSLGNPHQYAQDHRGNVPPTGYGDHDQQWTNEIGDYTQGYGNNDEQDRYDQNVAPHVPDYHAGDRHSEQYASLQPNHEPQRNTEFNELQQHAHHPNYPGASHSAAPSYHYDQPSPEQMPYNTYTGGYSQSPPAMPHGNSMPDVRPAVDARVAGHQFQRHSLPSGRGYNDRSPVQHRSPQSSFDPYMSQAQAAPEDDVPPPPPVHRINSGVIPPPLGGGVRSQSDSSAPIPGTAPLTIRKELGSFSNSPLSQVQTNYTDAGYPLSTSPSRLQHYAHPPAMENERYASVPTAARDAYHRRSMSPTRNGQALPPSLVPGYEPEAIAQGRENTTYREHTSHGQMNKRETPLRYHQTPVNQNQPRPHHAATISTQSPLQALERGPEQRPHRASAPVVQPPGISPNARIPMRKSVSPQPEINPSERRGSGVPFGPDSYDALNPFVHSGSPEVAPGAKYNTPEQAKEASFQHEREKKLGDGPIIGNDGRVIDPSDHLPTDTWAPEPEVKGPKKTPQVNIRFRNSPQGAQPMPPSSRRPMLDISARPASISTPTWSNNANNMADSISPTTAARARLQKKTRVSPTHPNSSPIVPTVNTALHNPVLRSTASDYPLLEHENYGYGSSPTYGRPSPSGIPPPVPGKVPMGAGQEDWRRDPLSEELSRIDIGVGGSRTRRFGYGR